MRGELLDLKIRTGRLTRSAPAGRVLLEPTLTQRGRSSVLADGESLDASHGRR